MKNPTWFAPYGWTYRPVTVAGWLLVVIAALYLIQVLGYLWLISRSIGFAVTIGFPFVVTAGTLLNWIASKTAQK